MSVIFSALFPIVMLIAAGYFLKHRHLFSAGFWAESERFNYYLLFPALFIYTLSQAQIDFAHLSKVLWVMVGVIGLASVACYGYAKFFTLPRAKYGVYIQGIVRYNSYISLALVAALFGQQGMGILAILLAASIPLVNVIAVLALTERASLSIRALCWSILKNPLISSCLVGIGLNVLDIPLWAGLNELLKLLAAMSLPMGLLCVGAALQFGQLGNQGLAIIANSALRLLAVPSLAWLLCRWLGLGQMETQIVVVFFAIPTGTATYILTKLLKGDSQLMAAIISVQTLLSMLSLPLVLWLSR